MKLWVQALVLVVMALPPAALTLAFHPRRPLVRAPELAPFEVTIDTVRDWPGPVLWVDARPESDYSAGRVPGALWLHEAVWEQQLPVVLERWMPEAPVVVYCAQTRCAASQRVAERLREALGSENVYFLQGGYEAWQTDGSR